MILNAHLPYDTFVIETRCLYVSPGTKSRKTITRGLDSNESPLNSRPQTFCGLYRRAGSAKFSRATKRCLGGVHRRQLELKGVEDGD